MAPADRSRINIIRGNRRHTMAEHARAPKNQKVAALPSGAAATPAATDAGPILVLRGTRRPRYALAGVPQPAPEPLLTVIRGARPRPVILQPYVQPNALILHIRR
jgi:molybdopterin-biosynthesis enzyme MoeA-like protein